MKYGLLTFALLASFAIPADAKDYALPVKSPAVTLTLPDNWNVSAEGNEINSVAADGYLVFNIAYGDRSDVETLLKDSKAYLKKAKVNLNIKPVAVTLDVAGSPARVQRYVTTAGSEKTIVDFVTVDASRDRIVLITIWGTKDEREANEAALSAVMGSIKVPADTGSAKSSFWSGGAAPVAEAPKTVASDKIAAAEKATASEAPVAAVQAPTPLRVPRNLFVTEKADGFGSYTTRASNTFGKNERILTYLEATGATLVPVEGGKLRFGYAIDVDVRSPQGEILWGKKGVIDQDLVVDASDLLNGQPKFFMNYDLAVSDIPAGTYVLGFSARDKRSDRSISTEQTFVVSP